MLLSCTDLFLPFSLPLPLSKSNEKFPQVRIKKKKHDMVVCSIKTKWGEFSWVMPEFGRKRASRSLLFQMQEKHWCPRESTILGVQEPTPPPGAGVPSRVSEVPLPSRLCGNLMERQFPNAKCSVLTEASGQGSPPRSRLWRR